MDRCIVSSGTSASGFDPAVIQHTARDITNVALPLITVDSPLTSSLPSVCAPSASNHPILPTNASISNIFPPTTSVQIIDNSPCQLAATTDAPSSLNPKAPVFFSRSSRSAKQRQSQQKTTEGSYTKEKAELDSLQIQLSCAKTKIADLENQNKEKGETIKIYLEKLKILESRRLDNIREAYFPSEEHSSPSHAYATDCPCQTTSKISRNYGLIRMIDARLADIETKYTQLDDLIKKDSKNGSFRHHSQLPSSHHDEEEATDTRQYFDADHQNLETRSSTPSMLMNQIDSYYSFCSNESSLMIDPVHDLTQTSETHLN